MKKKAVIAGHICIDITPIFPESAVGSVQRLLEPGKLVMEVKFTEMLPQIVRDILPPHAAEFTAVSKYVLCYEKTRYMNGFEYWYETQEREIL